MKTKRSVPENYNNIPGSSKKGGEEKAIQIFSTINNMSSFFQINRKGEK
jgi:hypothetical protein